MNDMAIGPTDGTGLPSVANVRFEIEVEGTGGPWLVERVSLTEAVSEPLRGVVEARVAADPPLAAELLGKELTLRIEREGQLRVVRAIVRHATTSSSLEDTRVTFHLVSSIWRLGLGIDTRTYLDVTIPELVREVVRERLGGAVTVDVDGLTQTYRRHEMLVQYQESPLAFLSRWMEQEGIFWFVAESDEGERMVLADAMENLPLARASEDGRVRHLGEWNAALEREAVSDLRHGESLGVTRVTLSELDWTRPSMPIRAERNAGGPLQPPGEIYDHSDAVTLHGFDGRQYTEDTAERGAQIRSEALALARHRWTMRSNVVTAAAGHVLRIEGAPEADLDGAYMIVRTDGEGRAHRDGVGTWSCSHVLVPTSMPYRPIPKTPRPIVPGPETAFVVGPAGQEIHTDLHGRVKVHFHWDRIRGRDEESSSCWVRVAQRWAGDGFGTFFLPRIGMEVVVDFLGGNPDRPIVTGCVHN
ncbi:MAG TPA: type VI secretion system tip protein TssI/VgrG, partial [Sandaracinaceae bacterium]